jgi:superfamily I DNA and/or RNA helicase
MSKEVLDEEQWIVFRKRLVQTSKTAIQIALIVICTTTQVASDVVKDKLFDLINNDETSVATIYEMLVAWCQNETLIIIGDDEQMGPSVLTVREKNAICIILEDSGFARWRDAYMPAFRLDEQI